VFEAVEEEECWRQYEALHAGSDHKNKITDADNEHVYLSKSHTDREPTAVGFSGKRSKLLESSAKYCDHRAHMDNVEEVKPCVYSGRGGEQSKSSTFWLRRFDAVESADLNRFLIHSIIYRFYSST